MLSDAIGCIGFSWVRHVTSYCTPVSRNKILTCWKDMEPEENDHSEYLHINGRIILK
jgi:hypothetical protein